MLDFQRHRILSPLTIAIATIAVAMPVHAEIFKVVLPDGGTVYTDSADKAYQANQNVGQISVLDRLASQTPETVSTSQATASPVAMRADDGGEVDVAPSAIQDSLSLPVATATNQSPSQSNSQNISQKGEYQLQITNPEAERAYRRYVQPIEVSLQITPSLKAGDRVIYRINGKHIATTSATTISIPSADYDPEKYTLTVQIENIKGEIVANAERGFYILPNNVIFQQKRKAAAEAKAAYDKLPWYKKLKININL